MPACQTLAPTHLETPFAVPTRLDGAPYKADKVTVKRKSGYQEKKRLSRQKVAVKAKSGCQGKRWLSREKESVKRIFGIRDAWELPEGRVRRPPRNTRAAGRRRGRQAGCRRRARGGRSDNRGEFAERPKSDPRASRPAGAGEAVKRPARQMTTTT